MVGVHIVDYTMPKLGYQDYLLPKTIADKKWPTTIITSDRYTPIKHYRSTWGKLLGSRITGKGAFREGNVNIIRLSPYLEIQRRILFRGLYKQLQAISPEYIFIHNIASLNVHTAYYYAKKYKIPIYIDSHITYTSSRITGIGKLYYNILAFYYKAIINKINVIYGVAEECSLFLKDILKIPENKISLLPIGVNHSVFYFDGKARNEIRKLLNVKNNDIIILQTGKLEKEKGADILPNIIKYIPLPIRRRILVLYIGAGDSEWIYYNIIDKLNRLENVRFKIMDFMVNEKLAKYFSASDICIYPRASSLSALEAAACKNLVIMSSTLASKWRAKYGVGISNDFDLTQKTTKLILRYILDNKSLNEYKNLAQTAVMKYFTYNAIAQQFMNNVERDKHKK